MQNRLIPFFAIPLSIGSMAMSACAEAPAQTRAETVEAPASGGELTSILNAGVIAEFGPTEDNRAKFLFDPLYDNHFGSLQELTPDLIDAIVAGSPPYDAVDAVFVSHAHGDHFSAGHITAMLAAQPSVQVVAPTQALNAMREEAAWQTRFESRVRAIALDNGETSDSFEISGALIEAFRSPHSGWPDRHANVHNITYRVSIAAGEGDYGRVMHMGDADPGAEHYTALQDFLAAHRTGVAMMPFWFYNVEGFDALLDETLNSESAIGVHVPVRVPAALEASGRPYFGGVGQVVEIPITP